jgi:cytochrome c biogenesis protein CcmG, thiol:disulfide interchange protein DsbE
MFARPAPDDFGDSVAVTMIPTDELEDYPKRTSVRRFVPLAVGLLLVGAIAYGVLRPAQTNNRAGERAPDFSLAYLDDSGTLSSDDLVGNPVVLNFWASWCIPCRDEMPLFEKKWREYRDEGITFVGVLIRDTKEDALAFVERNDITYPIVWDPDQQLARALGVSPLPETFFIDSTWNLIPGVSKDLAGGGVRTFGAIDEAELQDRIDRLLGDDE